jgi:hypothetical protein
MGNSLTRSVGDGRVLAVEFVLSPELPRIWNEWWGRLSLSVAGRKIENSGEIEMVWTGLASLRESARDVAASSVSKISRCRPQEALSLVMQARYGEDSSIDDGELAHFEVLPSRTGPFFDGWEAVLIPNDEAERFIYRHGNESVSDALWPKGTFLGVMEEACREFELISKGLLPLAGTLLVRTN